MEVAAATASMTSVSSSSKESAPIAAAQVSSSFLDLSALGLCYAL